MLAYGTITISDEMRGSGVYKITTAPSSYTTTTGGFTPKYRIALSTVKSQAGVTEVLIGDILEYSYYHYPVGYVDGSYVYLGTRVSFRGATGASATAYSLIVSHAAIVKAEDGTFTPDEITLTAKSQTGTAAMANYTGRLVIETTTDNSTWTNGYNQDAETYTYTIPSGIVAVRCSLYVAGGTATLLDQQIVPVVSDGASGGKGEDAYTVILTNENHTFAGGTSAALAGSTTCNVVAYKGATQVAATIGTISGAPTGMSTTITSNGTTSAYFTVTVTTSMVTKNGVLTVPVTVDGKSFSMKFSYSLALAGTSVTISSITYATSTTETQPADSAFTATTAPTVAEGNWLWTKVTFSSGNSVYTKSKQGKSGTNGTSYYTFIRYSTNSDGNPMVETPTDDTLYIGVYTGTSSTAPAGYGSYTWSRYTGKDGKMLYGTCSTTASTAAKSVACAEAKELYSGLTIMIAFSTANTAAAPTLNVNSLGAKNIYFDGANASSSNLFLWGAGASIQFTYNGTAWVPVGHPCTYYGACSTVAGTAAKVSTINQVVVCKGTTVNLQMTNANTVASATLNISSTGAKTIYANGAVLSADSPYNWIAGSTVAFTFDGTYWRLGDTSANSKAVAAQTAASAAQDTADAALTSANGKNKVYHQASQPSGGTYVTGDTWFDTDDGYKMYTYNGSSWVAEEFGTNAISDLAITNAKIADATIQSAKIATVDAGTITTGVLDAARINAGSITIGKLDTSTQTSIVNGNAAKTAIDNLEIGSRNYLQTVSRIGASGTTSGVTWTLGKGCVTLNGTSTSYSVIISQKCFGGLTLEPGTYSVWTDSDKCCFRIGKGSSATHVYSSEGTFLKSSPYILDISESDIYYVAPIVKNGVTFSNEVVHFMLEKGNKPSDWSPAPEDVEAAITDAIDNISVGGRNYYVVSDAENGYLNETGGVNSYEVEDSTPYIFRRTGDGKSNIGDHELDEIVGCSVAWNQLMQKGTFLKSGGTCTTDVNGVATFTASASGQQAYRTLMLTANTVYLVAITFKTTTATTDVKMRVFSADVPSTATTGWQTAYVINKVSGASNASFGVIDRRSSGWDAVTINPPMVFNLTVMFGSAVADALSTMSDEGIKLFRSWYPKLYYAYSAPTMEHVSGLEAHDMVGFNAFDIGASVLGESINTNTGVFVQSVTAWRSDFIKCLPETQYRASRLTATMNNFVAYYDADKTFISRTGGAASAQRNFTTPTGCRYIVITQYATQSQTFVDERDNVCISILDSTRTNTYEPYKKYSYPLDSSLTLRGLIKYDATKGIYADGDTYAPDGTVTRRYGIVDLGTLTWSYNSDRQFFTTDTVPNRMSGSLNLLTAKYTTGTQTGQANISDKMITSGTNVTSVVIRDLAYTSAATFKAAMLGVYLVYEKSTVETETAIAYASKQKCDDYGTEEYVTTGLVPVGHNTQYATPEYTSDYIDVTPGETIIFQSWITRPTLWMAYCFYNANKALVGSRVVETSTTDEYKGLTIEVPSNAYYMRVSSKIYGTGQVDVEHGNVATEWSMSPEDIESDIDDAKKVATNYMSSDSTGIMVADLNDGEQTPSTATGRNVRITNTAVEVRDGQDVKASFGEKVVIGDENSTRVEIAADDTSFYGVDGNLVGQIANGDSTIRYTVATELYYTDSGITSDISGMSFTTTVDSLKLGTESTIEYTVYLGFVSSPEETYEPSVSRTSASTTQINSVICPFSISYTPGSETSTFVLTFGNIPDYHEIDYIYVEVAGFVQITTSHYHFGLNNTSSGQQSFAEGSGTTASGNFAHSEGYKTRATDSYSHSEGYLGSASGMGSHAEGGFTAATASYSHAEGFGSSARSASSHAEGYYSKASADTSHAEGNHTEASGSFSHSQNDHTVAYNLAETALGRYNANTKLSANNPGTYAIYLGNGTSSKPNNALLVDWKGNVYLAMDEYEDDGTKDNDLAWGMDALGWMTNDTTPSIFNDAPMLDLKQLLINLVEHYPRYLSAKPTFTVNSTNVTTLTQSVAVADGMVVGSFRAVNKIQFAASTSYIIGTMSPKPSFNAAFFVRCGNVFNIQGWVGASDGGVYVQSASAIAANKTFEGMFIYKPA